MCQVELMLGKDINNVAQYKRAVWPDSIIMTFGWLNLRAQLKMKMIDNVKNFENPNDSHWLSFFRNVHILTREKKLDISNQSSAWGWKFLADPMNVKYKGGWLSAAMHTIIINHM